MTLNDPELNNPAGETNPSERFFKEIEIEFLVHELKDPISVVESGIRTLLEKKEKFGRLSPRQERTLNRALRNTRKAWDIINNLLEVGRSESGCFLCQRFRPAETIYEVLHDALETVAGNLNEELERCTSRREADAFLVAQGIVFNFAPETAELEIFQDEVKFRQIVGNLFKNALHYRRQRLEMTLQQSSGRLTLDVSDDGPGIDPNDHETVFRRYAQLMDCSYMPRKGHGLGLAGAQILARCLGGDIAIHQSRKGQGATFRLTLPLQYRQIGKETAA
jgi:signal transduction histidine kinase